MKIKEYYKEAFKAFVRFFVMLATGTAHAIVRLFRRYPNQTWVAIMAVTFVLEFMAVGQARSERDHLDRRCTLLQQQIDSLQRKDVKYTSYK